MMVHDSRWRQNWGRADKADKKSQGLRSRRRMADWIPSEFGREGSHRRSGIPYPWDLWEASTGSGLSRAKVRSADLHCSLFSSSWSPSGQPSGCPKAAKTLRLMFPCLRQPSKTSSLLIESIGDLQRGRYHGQGTTHSSELPHSRLAM